MKEWIWYLFKDGEIFKKIKRYRRTKTGDNKYAITY